LVQISHEFTVDRPPDAVWEFFQNIPEVATCMPGAELTEVHDDDRYSGKVSVKLGAMTATFEGQCTIDPDHGTRVCTIEGKGVDRRGGSRGQVAVNYAVNDVEGRSHVTVDADVKLSGAAAQFGRAGLITEMSNRLINEFVQCLEAKLEATTPEEAAAIHAGEVKGFSLFFASLWSAIKRLFRRG
jgi:carbon monoxide dehydrogenase subunit G